MSAATGGSSVVGSLSTENSVFSLQNEHDTIALLRQIHLRPLDLNIKNTLRDSIFRVRFVPGTAIDANLIKIFAQHGFTISDPVSDRPKQPGKEDLSAPSLLPVVPGFGQTRLTPQFSPVSVSSEPTVASIKPELPIIVPSPTQPPSTTLPSKLSTTPNIENRLDDATSPEHQTPPSIEIPEAPVTTDANAALTPSSVIPPTEPNKNNNSTSTEITTATTRIDAIKREVNARVGNPVNLIDVDNEVGREYMNALLDAMKKTSGGTTAMEVERVMARLERAFAAVTETLAAKENGEMIQTVASASISETTPPVPVASVVPTNPTVPSVSPQLSPVSGESTNPASTSGHLTSDDSITADPSQQRRILSVQSLDVDNGNESEQKKPVTSPIMPSPMVTTGTDIETTPSTTGITSVAKEAQLSELLAQREQAVMANLADQARENLKNPLMAEDVTNGLHQLLSEWQLFKSSGFFGTGPSGYDHPLYEKISQLTMATVLAGRFEGATPEVKRSISDYMNGWRYEEGITHEQGETFEHYLRRVIRHILDQQVKTPVDAR